MTPARYEWISNFVMRDSMTVTEKLTTEVLAAFLGHPLLIKINWDWVSVTDYIYSIIWGVRICPRPNLPLEMHG